MEAKFRSRIHSTLKTVLIIGEIRQSHPKTIIGKIQKVLRYIFRFSLIDIFQEKSTTNEKYLNVLDERGTLIKQLRKIRVRIQELDGEFEKVIKLGHKEIRVE